MPGLSSEMAVTNAICAIVIVGAMPEAGLSVGDTRFFCPVALALSAISVFGGFRRAYLPRIN